MRKYALERVGKGDYVFLSNDDVTVWRVARYREDGSAVTASGRELRAEFWGVWRFMGRDTNRVYPIDWNDFEMYEHMVRSRREAIEIALGHDRLRPVTS